MKKVEYSLKPVSLLRAIGTITRRVPLPSGRFAFEYESTAETEQILADYNAHRPIHVSLRAVLDQYTMLLHETRSARFDQANRQGGANE